MIRNIVENILLYLINFIFYLQINPNSLAQRG